VANLDFEDKTRVLMSGLGHKRTWRGEFAMSALPPKADISSALCDGIVPKADKVRCSKD
jgi:hypothetical protein